MESSKLEKKGSGRKHHWMNFMVKEDAKLYLLPINILKAIDSKFTEYTSGPMK